jgi:peptidyl-dipeptidase Dcp
MERQNHAAGNPPNPLLDRWSITPFELPPFEAIRPGHFRPAFDAALERQREEVRAIVAETAAPTFDNTIAALERSGADLARVAKTFFVVSGAHTNDALEAVEREVAPLLARHRSAIYLDAGLFARVDAVYSQRDALDLTAEQRRLVDRYHTVFVRAGAAVNAGVKRRLAEISERLAALGTAFGQNILADEKAFALVLDSEEGLAGLPDFVRAAAASEAQERGLPSKHIVTLARSSIEPFLQFSARRDLREKAFQAWVSRGDNGGATDNKATVGEIVALRAERARLLGYASFADYRLADNMAKTPDAVQTLLDDVWVRARSRALEEQEGLQAMVRAEGGNFALAPWDWRYYAEKLRKARYDLDEAEIKPYLQLDNVIAAAFHTANRLFGLTFAPVYEAPTYHPDVRVWEVHAADGGYVGLFMGDYFARPSKRSGAWSTSLRDQEKLRGDIRPIIVNVMNFAGAGAGQPTLLSFDDARTLFHEFGHALHGLLSDVTYPLLAGTSVASDFVEFPSQVYEHWLEQPEILRRFAVHYRSGAPMPEALIGRLRAARNFNQGFAAVEFIGSAQVDLDLHRLADASGLDVNAFESESLARIGMPTEIVMRHRTPHFAHVFTGGGYAAGYYSYLWSEMLDADGFHAFEEAGDIFDAATARRLRDYVYSAGNLRDPEEAYRAFRGRLPSVDALLKGRGLAGAQP